MRKRSAAAEDKGGYRTLISIPGYEVGGILLSEEEIAARVAELGQRITQDYAAKSSWSSEF